MNDEVTGNPGRQVHRRAVPLGLMPKTSWWVVSDKYSFRERIKWAESDVSSPSAEALILLGQLSSRPQLYFPKLCVPRIGYCFICAEFKTWLFSEMNENNRVWFIQSIPVHSSKSRDCKMFDDVIEVVGYLKLHWKTCCNSILVQRLKASQHKMIGETTWIEEEGDGWGIQKRGSKKRIWK